MKVSVIIPTYKRANSLTRCLDALDNQTTRPDEIIVVARHEDEPSLQVVRDRGTDSLILVEIEVPAGRPGFVAALNAGIDASRGEIVCLTDDDAEPHADWISRILATLDGDPSIGAVGGRDWIVDRDGHRDEGAAQIVGRITAWGRLVGRHHIGVGPLRDVDVLKGVNLSVRGHLIRDIRFDKRLRGITTEQNSEPGLCLAVKRMGYRVVYDPAIAVDHHVQDRVGESRRFGPVQVRDAAHNETLALLEHLSRPGQATHMLWVGTIGHNGAPGVARSLLLLFTQRDPKLRLLAANLTGRVLAVWTYLRSPRDNVHLSGDPRLARG